MPELMNEETKAELVEILSHLRNPVKILFFTEKVQCPACQMQQEILETVTALSEKLELRIFNSQEHQEGSGKVQY
jgi:peroxiredoxin